MLKATVINSQESGQEDHPLPEAVATLSVHGEQEDDVEANHNDHLYRGLLAAEETNNSPLNDKKPDQFRFNVSTTRTTTTEPQQQQQPGAVITTNRQYWGRFNDPHVQAVRYDEAENNNNNNNNNADNDVLPVATARLDDRQIRLHFIRKVYLILSAQLLLTFVVCAIMAGHEATRHFVLTSGGMMLYYSNFVICLVLICSLQAYKRAYPTNFVLLSLFTVSMALMVGTITAMYADAGAGDLVLEAIFITATVFLALTVYTLQSKWDFSFMGAGLGMGLWIMILWGFFGLIFGLHTGSVYALLGSILFSLYIIYDTYMIAERLDPEDYVVAAIELYLDLVNLFLYILRLLSEMNRR